MDHLYIEEHAIAFLYSTGKLSSDERHAFEEHFVDCTTCLDQLDLLENLRSGLRDVATESAAMPPATIREAPARTLRWFSFWRTLRLSRYYRVAVLAAGCGLVGFTVFLLWQIDGLRHELDRTRLASINLERRYQQELAKANLEKPEAASAAIFPLSISRSLGPVGEPENHLAITPAAHWIVLALQRDYETGYEDYRATLSDAAGRIVWQQNHLVPSSPSSMGIVIPSSIFRAGDFLLTLEGAPLQPTIPPSPTIVSG